jgi:hypothetical protein
MYEDAASTRRISRIPSGPVGPESATGFESSGALSRLHGDADQSAQNDHPLVGDVARPVPVVMDPRRPRQAPPHHPVTAHTS